METGKILRVALDLGDILLKSGAEVYRVEETIIRVCKSYDIDCDCHCTLTGIFISSDGTTNDIHSLTVIKRVKNRTVDLHKIELVNKFSRELENRTLTYEEATQRIKEIKKTPYFSFKIMLTAAAINAYVYSILFGGTPIDGLVAFVIGTIIYGLKAYISRYGFFEFLQLFLSGIIAGAMALLFKNWVVDLNVDRVVVGSIMVFMPGVAITSGIKDALNGDIISSFGKIGEGALVACALGAGVGITLVIGNSLM